MKLTPWEIEFLNHRLGTDAITESLLDGDETGELTEEKIELEQAALVAQVEAGAIDLAALTELQKDILTDAVLGSTWFACCRNQVDNLEMSPQQFGREVAKLRRLLARMKAEGVEIRAHEVNLG